MQRQDDEYALKIPKRNSECGEVGMRTSGYERKRKRWLKREFW